MKKLILSLALVPFLSTPPCGAMDSRDAAPAAAEAPLGRATFIPLTDAAIAAALESKGLQTWESGVAMLAKLPIVRVNSIVEATSQFMKPSMFVDPFYDAYKTGQILAVFKECDEDPLKRARKILLTLTDWHMEKPGFNIVLKPNLGIVSNLAQLPTARFDSIVGAISQLMQPFMSEHPDYYARTTQDMLDTFKECDEDPLERAKRITSALVILNMKETYATLIERLVELPSARFDSIVQALAPFVQPNTDGYIWQLLGFVRDLPEDRMQGIVTGAQVLMRPGMYGYDIERILQALQNLNLPNEATVARAHREAEYLKEGPGYRGRTNNQVVEAIITRLR